MLTFYKQGSFGAGVCGFEPKPTYHLYDLSNRNKHFLWFCQYVSLSIAVLNSDFFSRARGFCRFEGGGGGGSTVIAVLNFYTINKHKIPHPLEKKNLAIPVRGCGNFRFSHLYFVICSHMHIYPHCPPPPPPPEALLSASAAGGGVMIHVGDDGTFWFSHLNFVISSHMRIYARCPPPPSRHSLN